VKPTKAQIKAVRHVLYDHTQVTQMIDDIQSINVLMNLSGPPLPENDVRVAVGDGPEWIVQATGALDPSVSEAVTRCHSIAQRLQTIRAALSALDLPHSDKQNLKTALQEQALAWTTRAGLWAQPKSPSDPKGTVAKITAHEKASSAALAKVKAYLQPVKVPGS
jgi:hypothetical protein